MRGCGALGRNVGSGPTEAHRTFTTMRVNISGSKWRIGTIGKKLNPIAVWNSNPWIASRSRSAVR